MCRGALIFSPSRGCRPPTLPFLAIPFAGRDLPVGAELSPVCGRCRYLDPLPGGCFLLKRDLSPSTLDVRFA